MSMECTRGLGLRTCVWENLFSFVSSDGVRAAKRDIVNEFAFVYYTLGFGSPVGISWIFMNDFVQMS